MLRLILTLTEAQLALWLAWALGTMLLVMSAYYLGYKKGKASERRMLKCFMNEEESRLRYKSWLKDKELK